MGFSWYYIEISSSRVQLWTSGSENIAAAFANIYVLDIRAWNHALDDMK